MTIPSSSSPSGASSKKSSKPRLKNKQQRSKNPLAKLNIRTVCHLAHQLGCEAKELEKYAEHPEAFYRQGTISSPKKNRPKCTPVSPRLKEISKRLNDLLQRLKLNPAIHGGRRGHSTISNARPHVGQRAIIKLDIQDFYPSISREMVREAFIYRCGCSPEVATVIAAFTTPFNCLPQGSSHSSMVAAVVVDRLVYRLRGLVEKHGGACSQFVDDSTLSGPAYLGRLKRSALTIIEEEGFKVHPDKLEVLGPGDEQCVTGWKVNHEMRAPPEMIRRVKTRIEGFLRASPKGGEIPSVLGQIRHVENVEPGTAKQLRRKLIRVLRCTHDIELG